MSPRSQRDMGPAPHVSVAHVPLANLNPEQAAHLIASLAARSAPVDVHFVNAYTISLVDSHRELYDVIAGAGLNLADGKSVTWAARWVTGRPLEQVRGPDLFERVLSIGAEYDLRHFLLGGAPETLTVLQGAIAKRHPTATVAGSLSPPFRALSEEDLTIQDAQIRQSGANIVWVGLGTPKQDFVVARLASTLNITAVAVGAAFDFSAGNLRRAPEWMSRTGLEWVFRFAMEPRRLWRRYTVGNARFLRAILRSALQGRSGERGEP